MRKSMSIELYLLIKDYKKILFRDNILPILTSDNVGDIINLFLYNSYRMILLVRMEV